MAVSMGKGWKPKFLLHNLSEEEKEETASNVAWRMINIYRQLHIFSKEDIEKFNAMLMATDMELQMLMSEFAGGAEVTRYLAYLRGQDTTVEKPALDAKEIAEEKAKARILAEALAAKDAMGGEKVIKVQVDGSAGGGNAGAVGVGDAFANALPPVPSAGGASALNIDNVSFGDDSVEKIIGTLVDAQNKANEQNASVIAKSVAEAISSSQENSTAVLADALTKLSNSNGVTPIDVAYSPVQSGASENMEMLTSFVSEISEKMANTIANSLSVSQENNTKALGEIVKAIANENKAMTPEAIATAIAKGMEGISLGSVKMELDKPLKMELDGPVKMALDHPVKMELDKPLKMELDGPMKFEAPIGGGSGMDEGMLMSMAQAFANAQIEVSKSQLTDIVKTITEAQVASVNEQSSNLIKAMTDAQMAVSENQAESFARAFAVAQTDVSEKQAESLGRALAVAQADNSEKQADSFAKAFAAAQMDALGVQFGMLADGFAKAVTSSQSEISSALHEVVAEFAKSSQVGSAGLSASDISEIVANALKDLHQLNAVSSDRDVMQEQQNLALVVEKMMASFTETQLEVARNQNENIEKTLDAIVENIPVIATKVIGELPSTYQSPVTGMENNASDTYKEMWLGAEDYQDDLNIEFGINNDTFDGNIGDEIGEVSLQDTLASDPYNLLLKQKKVFKDHKLLYDSEVGLHVAYSGNKKQIKEGEK